MQKGFTNTYKYISGLKLSYHGYIIVCGPSNRQPGVTQYLFYSINGELLRTVLEKAYVKGIFLTQKEDQLIVATNTEKKDKDKKGYWEGNIRVLNLYGFETVAKCQQAFYAETID